MYGKRILSSASAILFAFAVNAQMPPPKTAPPTSPQPMSPTGTTPATGGTQPAPKTALPTSRPPMSPTGTTPATGGTQPAPMSPTRVGPSTATPNPTFPTSLFQLNDVSRSINLTDRQANRLNTMTQQLQTKYRTQYDRLSSLPEPQRADRLLQLNREYTNAWFDGARSVLD